MVTYHIPITFAHSVDRQTLLDDDDANQNYYFDNEISYYCLQRYIVSETSFPKDIKNIYCLKLVLEETNVILYSIL